MASTRRYTWRLCIAIAVIAYALWRNYRVHQDIRYTVATTIRQVKTPRASSEIQYQFHVDDKVYNASAPDVEKYRIVFPNGRYYVRFPYKTPGANEILWDRPVPDSTATIPSGGWKEIPE